MPIKDQCERCQHHGMSACPEGTVPSSFDGHSCESYCKRTSINLSKPEDSDETPVEQSPAAKTPLESSQPVAPVVQVSDETPSGWLAFFLYWALPIGSIVSLITNISSYSAEDFGFVDVGLSASLVVLVAITIFRFVKHKPDAVILAKSYLIICFVINLLVLIGGEVESSAMTRLVRSLISGVAWFWYLTASEQVERIIPKSSRKFTPLSKWVIAVFVAIPLLFIGYVSTKSVKDQFAMFDVISEDMLQPGEYTDGKFVFKAPYGYEMDSAVLEDSQLTVFSLTNNDDVSYTFCCDYLDTEDFTQQEFDEYWTNWEDDDLKEISSMVNRSSRITINDNPAFFKVVKYYNAVGSIYWYFAMIHHEATGKTAVVSSYRAEDDYSSDFIDFLNTIQFHK